MANGIATHPHADQSLTNGYASHAHDTRPAPTPPLPTTSKKGKQKKAMDSHEASKLVAARISQLELDAAGEKDQEAEIGELKETPLQIRVGFGLLVSPYLTRMTLQNGRFGKPIVNYTARRPR
jgi:hypothetical protein